MTDDNNRYGFVDGKAYLARDPETIEDYRDTALAAERYISRFQVSDADGIYWRVPGEDRIDVTLHHGSAGGYYFYIKLYKALGDERYKNIAKGAADYTAEHWHLGIESPSNPPFPLSELGLHYGIAGTGLGLLDAYQEFDDERYLQAAERIADFYRGQVHSQATGSYWTDNAVLMLDGGVLLFLAQLYLAKKQHDETLRELIESAARHILSKGIRTDSGALRFDEFRAYSDATIPGFMVGSAGIGYLFAVLADVFDNATYLKAAKDVALYLDEQATPVGGGVLNATSSSQEGSTYWLGICSGVAGIARLFFKLYQLTGDDAYLHAIGNRVDGLEALGAPEHESLGLWNTLSYCCGVPGLLQFFIGLYAHDGDPRWKALARRSARVLLGQAEVQDDGSVVWPLAWEHAHKDVITRPIGYFNGAQGIAASLIQLYQLERGAFAWSRLISDPLPANLEFQAQ
ncbi:lanthionine synthetase LanC family protein [Bifidobacterium cebidarum]|uniref:lanthionine synthetase LanC family protein n=1 Tax=Bifidobacterium cebidarum TaxID=2650773 RepID=UPI001D00606D|nr:lanthionine synthetase LanC family protein [Bifidobacterium cebidarum]